MKQFLSWWYRISMPVRPPDTTPKARERTRYARLTSTFLLVLLVITVPTAPLNFVNAYTVAGPIIAVIALGMIGLAWLFSWLGYNWVAAGWLVVNITTTTAGNMLVNPLDPSLIPLFSTFVISVILAGALMPPVAAIVVALMNSGLILFITLMPLQPPTAAYVEMMEKGLYSITVVLPIIMQIIIAFLIYAIMRSLLETIRRADRAEEIIALQQEIAERDRARMQERQQLEEGISVIAKVHSDVANGNFTARVPVGSEHVLWKVAVPLNNLLNRIQPWKSNADQYERMQAATRQVALEMQRARLQQTPVYFQQQSGTVVDTLLPEVNHLSEQAYNATRQSQQ